MKSLDEEKRLISLLKGKNIYWKGEERKIILCEKPLYSSGEGKTDIYILFDNKEEIKISLKQNNADFVENKVSAKRAEKIFGTDWKNIISNTALSLQDKFSKRQLYYPQKTGRIEAGSYTLGWRLDITNKKNGELSKEIVLTEKQKEEIMLGTLLPLEKRDAKVSNKIIKDSGIANYLLFDSEKKLTPQDVFLNLSTQENYILPFWASFKAVNYRSISNKVDGNRPLAVYVNYESRERELIFNSPLIYGAKRDVLPKLKKVIQ